MNGKHEKERRSKKGVALVSIAAGALLLSAGGVYAANSIQINSDNTIEFGQGAATTTTCDTEMYSNLSQSWSQTDGFFKVDSVNVGYGSGACTGKTIHVTLLNSSGNAICGIDDATFGVTALAYDSGFTANTSGASCDAGDVARVAITTSN